MKKIMALFGLLFLASAATACGITTTTATTTSTTAMTTVTTTVSTTATTTTSPLTTTTTVTTKLVLAIPANLRVVDNLVQFDSVSDATRYKVRVLDGETLIGEYIVASGFDLSLLVDFGAYQIQVKAIGTGDFTDSGYSDAVAIELVDPDATNILEAELLNDYTKIRWLGRTYYETLTGRRYFWATASGFDVSFYGTELKVTFYATKTDIVSKQPYIVVLVDGEADPTKGTTIILNQLQAEYTLVTGLEEGFHSVKVVKRSEAQDSDTAVLQVSTDGHFTAPNPAKALKIEYIGASSTVGYGDLGPASAPKTTSNSNGLLCFTYLTSYLLDAETSIFASSGWGLTRGWNTGGAVSATQNIPAAYEYYAINGQNYIYTAAGQWDHTNYEPDVLVLVLGGNDFSSSNYSSLTVEEQAAFRASVTAAYVAFIATLRLYHPDAYIVVVYGVMGEAAHVMNVAIDAANQANTAYGQVTSIRVESAGSNSNPYGSDWHPNVGTYIKAAEQLADHIAAITGQDVVRENIVY